MNNCFIFFWDRINKYNENMICKSINIMAKLKCFNMLRVLCVSTKS